MTRQTDYALQLILALRRATAEKPLSLKHFAKDSSISFLILQKVARALRQWHIVAACKGRDGGYYLKKPVAEITVREVMEAVEGLLATAGCACFLKHGRPEGRCRIRQGVWKLHQRVLELLEKTSVAELAK